MTRRIARGLVPITAAAAILVACTTTTGGHGQAAPNDRNPFSATSSAAPATPTATVTTTATATAPTTSSPSSAPSSAPAPTQTHATPAQVAAELTRLTPGQRRVIVARPGGADAVTYDQAGQLSFWSYATAWARAGHSTYPYDKTFQGDPSATATGAVLTGMTHATFIVHGFFSGDGSGNAVAYTTGSKGWGAIKAEPNGNIGPSGQGVGFSAIGLADDFEFAHGLLESVDCSVTGPIAACGGSHRVFKYWQWAGHDFVLKARAGLSR